MTYSHEDLFHKKMDLMRIQVEHFMAHDLNTWQWWLLVALTILPWVLWVWIRDKRTQNRMLFGALLTALFSLVLDIIGTQFGLWYYGVKLIPSLPPLFPYDLTVMPVEYLLIQRVAKSSKQFIWIALIAAVFNGLLAEPILNWMDVYKPLGWKRYYSIPIYFLIFYLSSKAANQASGWEPVYKQQ